MWQRFRSVARLAHDPSARHRLRARLAGLRHRIEWRWRAARLRQRFPGRPIILVGMVEHLGDIVAAEPVVPHLKRSTPDALLVWAVRRPYRELVDHHPDINITLPVGCLSEWIGLKRSDAFDRVVDLQVHGRDCPECHSPLVRRAGDHGITIQNYYHHGNLLEIFCRCGGLSVLREGPRIHIPAACRQTVDALDLPERFVVLHCASNQVERDWAEDKWRHLAEALIRDGVAVVEVGLSSVVSSESADYIDLCGALSLLETAEVIRRAEAFVGIDSGPAHLANAVGTYGFILLGHYGPYTRYLPYSGGYADGSNAQLLYADGPAATIPVTRVRDALLDRVRSGSS